MKKEEVGELLARITRDIEDGKTDEEVFERLRPYLREDMEVQGEVAERFATILHQTAPKVLYRMLEDTQQKKIKKIIRRSLYRLKTKGITVGETPEETKHPVFRLLPAEPSKGFASHIDLLGHRLLLLAIPRPGRGLAVMEGLVCDTQGVMDFLGEEMTRKGFRNYLEEVGQRTPFPLIEMDPSYVSFLLVEASQQTVKKGLTPPASYLAWKSEIERIKRDYERPLAYSCFSEEDVKKDEHTYEQGGDLLQIDMFSSWKVEDDLIRPYAEAVAEARDSKIVLTQLQKEARFEEIYQKAVLELFSGDRRRLYQRRLEEMAYFLYRLGRGEEARKAMAAAIHLESPLTSVRPHPFLWRLVVASILSSIAQTHERQSREPSLIVKP